MDYFSDDDLDTLNANALQELENNAIQFTQAQKVYDPTPGIAPNRTNRNENDYEYDYDDDDLDDAVVVIQDAQPSAPPPPPPPAPITQRPAQLPSRIAPHQQQPQKQQESWRPATHNMPPPLPHPPVSRPPAGPGFAGPRTSQQLPPRSQTLHYNQIPRPPPPLPRPAPSTTSRYQPSQAQRPTGLSSHELSTLQAQILDLKSKLATKDGEISIVRKHLEKSREDHERELQIIKTRTAEQLAKQERAVEAARAAQEHATTELQFTKRDLREEVSRAKRQDGGGTPKKRAPAKTWGVADGFEDVEMAGSPSKGQRGKNVGPVASSVVEPPSKLLRTPTKAKRKRPTIDSPVMALETHSEDVVMQDAARPDDDVELGLLSPGTHRSVPFDFLKIILNHSAGHGRPLTFQSLSGFKLKSRPNETLASILLQTLSTGGQPDDATQLPVQFCLEVIQLWDTCLKDKYFGPIPELISLVSFTLQLQTVALAPHIAVALVPVAMDAIYEVAIPRHNTEVSVDPTDEKFIKARDHIDTQHILSLLYLTALGCATSEPIGGSISSPAVDFWSLVHIQIPLILLSRKQPMEDFTAMLRLLWTSVFPHSVGPINPDKTPEMVAQLLIDKMSVHLTYPADSHRWNVDEMRLRDVRLTIVQTLCSFAGSPFGLAQLAKHDWLLPRLATLLSHSIDELYDGDMQYSPAGEDDLTDGLQKLVAHIVFFLHMMIMNGLGGNSNDVTAKLSKTTGGPQRYLLSLSRLNFTDDLVSDDTAELAHELLEMAVTPEAGEELEAFFSG